MENFTKGKENEFHVKLMLVLNKITDPKVKHLDRTYLEKLLLYIKCIEFKNYVNLQELSEWFLTHLKSWKEKTCNTLIIEFLCKLIGIISTNEENFKTLQTMNIFEELTNILQRQSVSEVYIELLTSLLNHSSGYKWVINSHQWKVVILLFFSNSNLFVEKKCLIFWKNYISKSKLDENLMTEIFEEILIPLRRKDLSCTSFKNLYPKAEKVLRFLEEILKEFLFPNNSIICLRLVEKFNIETLLKSFLENSEDGGTYLDIASKIQVMLLILKFENKQELLSMEKVPDEVLQVFHNLLKNGLVESIIKLAKFCQTLWWEMKIECKSRMNFIILQLIIALVYKKPPDSKLLDLFIQKLFALTCIRVQKLAYLLRDTVKSKNNLIKKNWAIKSVLSTTGNIENLSHDEAVVIFQTMAYVVTVFIPHSNYDDDIIHDESLDKEILFCTENSSLLSAVLNAICILIEKFKIDWTKCLESLCLLKMTCKLLQNTHYSSIVVVQTLLLVKLAILNFMSPNLAFLLNNPEDSSCESLMPILYKKLHDPNWEVRDSCIEVIAAIAELAESKYPAFQQLLEKQNFCSLVFEIMTGDSESYVRASALRALSVMLKIQTLKDCLDSLNFPLKIIEILQKESEGIVRREAAFIITQVYLRMNESYEFVCSLYQVMGHLAVCDLHWEVKVNALIFWEAVIQHAFSDQGMIDGSFPKVTFSKEHKKIVVLTNDEIKLRLNKALKKLSKVGCLHVLLSTLNDDCDFLVVKKSAQILEDLTSVLKRYELIKSNQNLLLQDRVPMKRKNIASTNCEKRKPGDFFMFDNEIWNENPTHVEQPNVDSDSIIEEIVNEMDINLLVSVCQAKRETEISNKKIVLQEIQVDLFLSEIQNFDYDKFLQKKQIWFKNMEVDLNSFVNDIISMESNCETNIMDCY